MSQSAHHFHFPVRVYIEDTDAGGIVYYVNYLKFMERARSEWLRYHGLNQSVLLENDTQLVVHQLNCQYRRPAQLDDALTITARIENHQPCRMTFQQEVLRDEELLCVATVEIACLSAKRLRPKAWPSTMQAVLSSNIV